MQLQMLGTGGALAKKYFNTNALIYVDGYTLLIDCGITAPHALHILGKRCDEIDGILISHLHGDHIGGLEQFAFQMKFIYHKKHTLFIPDVLAEPLWNHSLKGGMDDGGQGTGLDDYFHVVLLHEGRRTAVHANLTVEPIRTEHIPGKPSFSFLLNDSLFFSADMRFNRTFIDALVYERKCKTLLHECQLHPPGDVHTTLDELLTLPEPVQEKIFLMHYGDDMEQFIGKTGKMRFIRQHEIYTLT